MIRFVSLISLISFPLTLIDKHNDRNDLNDEPPPLIGVREDGLAVGGVEDGNGSPGHEEDEIDDEVLDDVGAPKRLPLEFNRLLDDRKRHEIQTTVFADAAQRCL